MKAKGRKKNEVGAASKAGKPLKNKEKEKSVMPPAQNNPLASDMMAVLAKHGVTALPATTTAASQLATSGVGPVASYIREIITGDQAFDNGVLTQVGTMLSKAGQQS
jgi:hypothetical protein